MSERTQTIDEEREPLPAAPVEPGGPGPWVRLALIVAATVAIGFAAGLPTLLIILALVVMIFMHELGHYVTAKWAGMKVTEFFIGFGPRLWSFRRGETEYGLKAIPAGAYVRIIGMSNLEDVDPSEESRTYRQKPYWRRLSVAVAGSTMHFVMALVIFFAIFAGFGLPDPQSSGWHIGSVTVDSPADEAGLELGDRIVAVDGREFAAFADLRTYLRSRPGEEVAITFERDGREQRTAVTLDRLDPEGEAVGFLGVGPKFDRVREAPHVAAWSATKTTGETMWQSVRGLGAFFSPSGLGGYVDNLTSATDERVEGAAGEVDEDRIVSIYGAVRIASQASSESVVNGLAFLAAINVFIGVFNLVPLLPFDGGHVVIATYERIRSRKGRRYFADVAKLMPLTYAVVMVLAVIFVTSVYLDIADPINLQ